jgi:transcriptional regulator GlxA family with amidase domain
MDARILSVLEVVTRELEKPQSVKRLAAQLRLSPSRFEHLFKNQTGQGFKAFLLAARITKARNMLRDRTLRVKEVAAAVGYANVSNFIRDFTKYYGESPSRSRNSSLRDSLIPSHRGRA